MRRQKWERVPPSFDSRGRQYYSREEARKLRAERISQMRRGEFVEPSKMTFEQFKDIWLEKYARAEVSPTTLDQYDSLFSNHLIPYLGALTLAQMTVEHIQGLKANLQEKGLGPQMVKHGLRLVRQMLNHAVDWGHLRNNPALKVRYPSLPKTEIDPLTPGEIQGFFEGLAEGYSGQPTALARWCALHLVAITGALRIGEILAMRWGNLEARKGRYFVKETWHRPKKNRPAYSDVPKTKASIAPVDLSPSCLEALKEHQKMQKQEILKAGEKYRNQDLIFATSTGGPLHDINVVSRVFHPVLVGRAGIRKRRFHDLRHTCASLLIHQGESPKYVQKQLRHASIEMTFDTYGHLFPDENREAAARLDATLFGIKNVRKVI